MIINNKTDVALTTDRRVTITPGNSYTLQDNIFDTINVHSGIGSMIIIREYKDIHISPFGVLDAIVDKDNNVIDVVKRW